MESIELDVHTHTIASGHAYSSLSEMVAGAKEKDIKLLGIVEHDQGIPGTCAPIYFKNLDVIPREIEGIKLLLGIEINILDHQGRLSITEDLYDYVDYCMAGIHLHCYEAGTIEEKEFIYPKSSIYHRVHTYVAPMILRINMKKDYVLNKKRRPPIILMAH